MPDWPTVQFQILADDSKSAFSKPYGSAITKEDYVPQGVPVVRGANLRNGIFLDDEFVFIRDQKADQMPGANLTSGDLVFTHRGTIGQVSMIPRYRRYSRYVLSTSQVKARLDPKLALPEFYYYWFSSSAGQHELLANVSTVGVPGLGQPVATIKSLTVPYPPLAVQQAITDVLRALDEKIAIDHRLATTGDRLVAALAAETLATAVVPLGEIVRHVRDHLDPATVNAGVVAHYSLPAFDTGRLPQITAPASIKSNKFIIAEPSVLVSKLNPATPRVWNVSPASDIISLASTEFLVLHPRAGLSAEDVWAVCSRSSFAEELATKVTGTSNSHQRVSPADLLATPVVDPRSMPAEVRSLISAIATQVRHARTESSVLERMRDALLPRLMSGEIRVRDSEKIVEDVT